jgi:low affinity Fe/Cu permease
MMTLFITKTEHRDTQAIHAKIDELLRAGLPPSGIAVQGRTVAC